MKKLTVAKFYWHIYNSGNLWFLKQQAELCGGKITDETGRVVYDPGFEYNHAKFQEFYPEMYETYLNCIA